jgi:predicted nucleic acid-binding protein
LVKLFVAEPGSVSLMQLMEQAEDGLKAASVLGLLEVCSAIRRRQYAGDTSRSDADLAVAAAREESRRLIEHPITSTVLELASALVDRQNLRALDAIQLSTAILASQSLDAGSRLLFIASDKRLLLAAKQEGLDAWNPSE